MADRAETYTHGHADSVLRSHGWRTVENSAAYLSHRLVPGTEVLDVGCGPGTITLDIAARVAPGRVVGLEVSLAVGDVYALDHADDSFDVVHAHQVLQHLADPVAALREMRRVCRPGGVVAVRDGIYRAMAWFPAVAELDRWLEVYCGVAEANGGEPDAGSHLRSWALAAGFGEVVTSASAWCYATDDERTWWGGLWAERVSTTALGQRAVALGLATEPELTEMAEGWRSWSEVPDAWFAVPHGEVLATR